jgi:polar amino acid transport system substrate-binding protein
MTLTEAFQEVSVSRPSRRPFAAIALAAVAVVASACGGSSSGGSVSTQPSTGSSSPGVGVNSAAAAKVPASLKSAGVVRVASDASYPPNEFFASDNKTIIGMDVDLGKAIGQELGVPFKFTNVGFDSIIPSLGNRYDIGMSSFTDTKDREKTVDMVNYFTAGESFLVKAGSSYKPSSLNDLCGKNVAVEKGTTELDQATAQSKKCKLTVLAFPDENGANLALQSGRADVVLADTPVNDYAKALSNGAFVTYDYTGFAPAPYGIAVPKDSNYAGLSEAIQLALKDLAAKGTYQQILQKWHIQAGAITDFTINGAKS